MYNDAPNLPNARKWVAAADEYLKKTIQISDYREAERLKADANKILRQWQNKPKGPAPPPKPKHLPLQTQSEIQKLYEYKELNDALSNLAEEIVSNYENIQQFKASILPKITKLEVMLENYKTKVSQSSNPSMYSRTTTTKITFTTTEKTRDQFNFDCVVYSVDVIIIKKSYILL